MPLLDGAVSADLLPNSQSALLNSYADGLARSAVEHQRASGLPIDELLGVIVKGEDEDVAGVAKASEVVAELLGTVPPPGHLRTVVWDGSGIGMFRVDTMPTVKGGAS